MAVAAAAYVLLRVALAARTQVIVPHLDSPSYHLPPSFTGAHSRPWVVPALYSFVDGHAATLVQAALGGLAFVVLALAIGSTLRDQRVRCAVMVVVLMMGIAPRTTVWDVSLVSESVALSLTAILIAVLIWIDRLPWWVVATVFTLWVFTRDAHLYLGVLVLVGVAAWVWRRREWTLFVVMALVLGWAGLASRNNDTIEKYNVAMNTAWHTSQDAEMLRWFETRGMPASNALAAGSFDTRQTELLEDERFMQWAATEGPGLYLRYLATHPEFTFEALAAVFEDGDAPVPQSLVDNSYSKLGDSPLGAWVLWPSDGSMYSGLLSIAAIACLWFGARRRRLDGSYVLPVALLASTIPHAVLAYHATPWELGRHGAVLALVLVVSGWWLVALTVDRAVGAKTRDSARTSLAVDEDRYAAIVGSRS